jgi:hypothetical protein
MQKESFVISCNMLLDVSTLLGHLQGELFVIVTLRLHFIVEWVAVQARNTESSRLQKQRSTQSTAHSHRSSYLNMQPVMLRSVCPKVLYWWWACETVIELLRMKMVTFVLFLSHYLTYNIVNFVTIFNLNFTLVIYFSFTYRLQTGHKINSLHLWMNHIQRCLEVYEHRCLGF